MVFFGGFGGKSKNYDGLWVPYFCSFCNKISPLGVTENYRYGQVYGIRIAKYKSKYFLVCQICERGMQIPTREAFNAAQDLARQMNLQDETKIDYMKYVKEVARIVFQNYELVKILEEGENKNPEVIDVESENKQIEKPQTKICPDCAEEIKFAAKICRYCQHDFDENNQ